MAHKLIRKRDLHDDSYSKKGATERNAQKRRYRFSCRSLIKGIKGGTVEKSEMRRRRKERVVCALPLIEIFSSILSDRAGVSVVPNRVIKGINLHQELICSSHHGIFIRYYHSVMNLLITSDMQYMH